MKTSILVILFLLSSQILSQIESEDIINHRDFLKERMNHSTNPLKKSESSFKTNIFQNNDSRRTVNKTVLNDGFLLVEEIAQERNGSNWENLGICIGAGPCFQPPGGRHAYQYNESNNLTEDLWQDWDGASWVNFWKDTYTYDINQNRIEDLHQDWGGSNGENDYKIIYSYDENNNRIVDLSQKWDGSNWVNVYKIIYSYDENKNRIEDLWQEWNSLNWVNDLKSTYLYDANNNLIEDLWQDWDGSNWANRGMGKYTYDANNNMIEELRQDWDGSNWVNHCKHTYTYDINNNMIVDFFQDWTGSEPDSKHTYTYDANNNLIEDLEQDWDNSSWVNNRKETYTYDVNNNMIEYLYQGWYNSSWRNMFRSLYSYQPIAKTYITAGEVSGIWDYSGSPYFVQGEITIPNDSTLTIEPGVEVVFTGHYKFNVQGRLLAIGTETDTIVFTIKDTTGFHNLTIPDGGWHGIRFIDTPSNNDSSKIVYCKLQYGKANTGSGYYDRWGGVLMAKINKLLVSHCMFRNNTCYHPNLNNNGGGAIGICGDPIIEFCEFSENRSSWGSAMLIWGSNLHPLIRNNYFHHNLGHGTINIGSWSGSNTSPILINNIIADNISNGNGPITSGHGIIHISTGGGIPVLINNTFVNNSSTVSGGAIFVNDNISPLLINNIIYGNEPSQVYLLSSSSLGFHNCLIEGGRDGFTGAAFTGAYENCIDADPQFVGSNDYHLQNTSPCIGAGIDSILNGSAMHYCPPIDFEGNPRPDPAGSMPDIGAYENELADPVTAVGGETNQFPTKFALEQNYPNPFNPATTIRYNIPLLGGARGGSVTLKVFDVLGSEIVMLVNKEMESGYHSIDFNGSNLPSGVYFYQLSAANYVDTKKMILLR